MENINRLKTIFETTTCIRNKVYSFYLLLTYHINHLTIDELISNIPFVLRSYKSIDVFTPENYKFLYLRDKLKLGILRDKENVSNANKILKLLKNKDERVQDFGLQLLSYFDNRIVVDPLIEYLKTNEDPNKSHAIQILRRYNDTRVIEFAKLEYEKYKDTKDTYLRSNYLSYLDNIREKSS